MIDEPNTPPNPPRPDFFDDDTYPAPPPARSGRRPPPNRGRPTPWPMIIGVALLGILAAVMAIIVFGGDGGSPDGSPTPSASASTEASATASADATASESPSGSAEASSTPATTPTPVSFERDAIVAATVSDLSVRAGPTTSATRLGSLAVGMPAFVAGGPVDADGYRWYQLSGLGLPPSTGCAGPIQTDPFNCPVWLGWVASASQDGVPWLTDDAGDADECAPMPIDFERIVIGVTDLMRLSCFGSDPFTFRAFWPEAGAGEPGSCVSQDTPSGWLICQQTNTTVVTIGEDQGSEGIGLRVSIDPASGVSMPGRGTWVELTVHLDDPAAQRCGTDAVGADAEGRSAEEIVLACRGQMVLESASAVDGP